MRLAPNVLFLLAGTSLAACGAAPQATTTPVTHAVVASANDTTNGSPAPVTNEVAPVVVAPVTQVSNVPVESYPPPCGRG